MSRVIYSLYIDVPEKELDLFDEKIIHSLRNKINLASVFVKDKNNNYGTVCSSIRGLPNKMKKKNKMVWLYSEYKSSFSHLI